MRKKSTYTSIRYLCLKHRLVTGSRTFTVSIVSLSLLHIILTIVTPAPFNLLALIIFRPLRLFATGNQLRHGRIVLLKFTHAPIVWIILAYEWVMGKLYMTNNDSFHGPAPGSKKPFVIPPPNRPESRPQSGYRPRTHSPQLNSAELVNKLRRQNPQEDDVTEAPTDIEVRVAELSAKIDRLTALIVALQPSESLDIVRT